MNIEFHYDVVCPYAYIAGTRIDQMAAARGASVEWCPVLLGGIFQHNDAPLVPAQAWSAARQTCIDIDLHREARRHGIELSRPDAHPIRTVEAMRLIVGAPASRRRGLSLALWKAYWEEGRDVSDRAVLHEIATVHGVDPAVIDDQAVKDELRRRTAVAGDAGVFGVPAMRIGNRLWWGQDRLHFVEAALGGPNRAHDTLGSVPGGRTSKTVRFFHDFSSPFSYLAANQVQRLPGDVQWCPILLGALFRAIGTPDVPLAVMSPQKQRWVRRDLEEWAEWWGLPFQFPSQFPLRTVLALRISLLEPRATLPLYRAAWADDRDIGRAEVVGEVLAETGLDESLIEETQTQSVKDRLRHLTTEAADLGICGVPSFVVGTEIFWGQDRLDRVADWLVQSPKG